MKSRTLYPGGFSAILKRALTGRASPLSFLIILGFFSTLVLLYISLHVHFASLSTEIDECMRSRDVLRDELTELIAEKNELIAPERVIPLAEKDGMEAGSPDRIHRLATCDPEEAGIERRIRWAGNASASYGATATARSVEDE